MESKRYRVKPHPVCPECGAVMYCNGESAKQPRITYYRCPRKQCTGRGKLYDAFSTVFPTIPNQ